MGLVSRDEVRQKYNSAPTRDVDVPEWGEGAVVRVKDIGTGAMLKWVMARNKVLAGEPGPDPSAYAVVLAAVDDSGESLFTAQDCDWLSSGHSAVVTRVSDAVLELCGMSEQSKQDAEGNSDAAPNSDSPTDSPETSGEQSQS